VSPDPVKSAAEGATAAAIDWTEQKVRDFVKQFLNRKLAFIKDEGNIELVKAERKSTEFSILSQFVPKSYIIQVLMGLALREIATDQNRVIPLVDKIRRKYGREGLHIAEITQVGITNQLLTHLSQLYRDPPEVTKRLIYFLGHAEDLVIFVRSTDKPNAIITKIIVRIQAAETHIIILFGSGYAQGIVDKVLTQLEDEAPGEYVIERRREGMQIIAFIFTSEVRGNISHWSDSLSVDEKTVKA